MMMNSYRRLLFLLVFSISFVAGGPAAAETSPSNEVLLVCPKVFQAAMKPWVEYRTKQGYEVRQISSVGTKEQIQKRIRRAASSKLPAAIVLVGDAAPPEVTDAKQLARTVPNFRVPATINVRFNRAVDTGTDNNYADFDGDRVPEVPLGRLSVKTPDELRQVIEKIVAYESEPLDRWQQDINMVAGVGGFGKLIDTAIDIAAWQLIRQLPDLYRVTMTQASWSSPFCPTPDRFPETTMQRMNEGPFFWVYMGHGQPAALDRLRMPKCKRRIMTMKDLEQLRYGKGRTIALILACLAGKYDAKDDSLAERMVVTPGGPVAVIAASRVTMPYAMATMANGMIRQLFIVKATTLGEVCLQAKREMAREETKDPTRMMIDQIAKTFSPTRNELAEERLEHIELFHLFGDPLLKLPYAEPIELDVTKEVKRGEKITISGTLPFDGKLTIELIRSRRRPDYAPAGRSEFPATPDGLAAMQETYEKANQDYFHRQGMTSAKSGPFEMTIAVPKNAPQGRCSVRIYLTNGQKSAAGLGEVKIM